MAHRSEVHYIGAMRDPNFGVDDEGELFYTLRDAAAALKARHRNDGWESLPSLLTDGTIRLEPYPNLTDEAHIYLWELDSVHQHYPHLIAAIEAPFEGRIPKSDYFPHVPDYVVWVGARQGVRVGSMAEYRTQRERRVGIEVREAGSVVVTDA